MHLTPESIEDDWITNFFDKSRIISDTEMQKLWSRVLAGEANSPGSYSKRTVNCISGLDKFDAEIFTSLCGFVWEFTDKQPRKIYPLIFDIEDDIYNSQGINFSAISHLESIGLIQFNHLTGFQRLNLPKRFVVFYYGQPLQLEMPNDEMNTLQLGKVLLTQIGVELATICGSRPVDGYMDFVKEKWAIYTP